MRCFVELVMIEVYTDIDGMFNCFLIAVLLTNQGSLDIVLSVADWNVSNF